MAISAGVVLAGGRSSRMGRPKAALEWHGSTLLYRTAQIVAQATGGLVVVVRAPGQDLPDLPEGVLVTDDRREGRGPLQGIAAGLAALTGHADLAFVSSTDLPFLHPAFIRRVLSVLEDSESTDVALPVARGYQQPLAAAYRVSLAATAERLVAADRLRPAFLFEQCQVRRLDDAELLRDPMLAALDPDLDSVLNVNTPADYAAARARAARLGVFAGGSKGLMRNWPVFRQLTGPDKRGLGAAADSGKYPRARTGTADQVVKSVCPYCAVGCGQNIFVKNEKVVQIEGDPDSPVSRGRLCPKGSASLQLTTGGSREYKVKYRRPFGTEWEDLDLDTAMDMIADRVLAARRHGWQWEVDGNRTRRTLGFASLGGATLDNEENYLIKKLFTALGAIQIENQARI